MEFLLGLIIIALFFGVIIGVPMLLGAFPEYAIGAGILVGAVVLVVYYV